MNEGRICIALCPTTADELVVQLRRAEPLADIIEIRFDCVAGDQLAAARRMLIDIKTVKPLIATFRSPDQGGNRELTRDERVEFWRSIGDDFAYADVEQDVIGDIDISTRIIASQHDFAAVPPNVPTLYDQLAAGHPAVIKIAATAQDICDGIPIWKLIERAKSDGREIIPIAMGEAGKWTRILGLAHGAFLTYASLDTGKETAGGQVTADELINVYRAKELDRETRVYGVIGDPVSSSLSPFMQNAGIKAAGQNAVFLPLQVKDLDAFMRRMVMPGTREIELNFSGFSVTMPHKQAIMEYLDHIDPVAAEVGAVNTVKIEGGKLYGFNTDVFGFLTSLKERFPDLWNADVAVIGAGGAARAVVHALNQEGADAVVYARNTQDADVLAEELGVPVLPLSRLSKNAPNYIFPENAEVTFDVIVNTTPLGMAGPNEAKTPLTADELLGVRFVYDLVTRRDDTPLIREAKQAGVDAIGGVEMLIAQGLRQFEIWTGLDAPAEVMRAAVMDRLR